MNAEPRSDSCIDGEVGNDRFDGGDLCPACLAELSDGCGFCPACAAPVEPTSAVSPFERILAEGYVYRKMVAEPRNLLILVGAWLIFLPSMLFGGLLLRDAAIEARWQLASENKFWELQDWLIRAHWIGEVLGGLFCLTVGVAGVGQTLMHYRRRPALVSDSPRGT